MKNFILFCLLCSCSGSFSKNHDNKTKAELVNKSDIANTQWSIEFTKGGVVFKGEQVSDLSLLIEKLKTQDSGELDAKSGSVKQLFCLASISAALDLNLTMVDDTGKRSRTHTSGPGDFESDCEGFFDQ